MLSSLSFSIELNIEYIIILKQHAFVKAELGDDFSIQSVWWIQMKQIKPDQVRTRNTGAGKVNIWIFSLYSHGNNYLPAHTNKHKHTAVLTTVENTHRERGWKPQTQLQNEYKLPFSQSSYGVCSVFRFRCHPVGIPSLVLIHICGRCHSIFHSASQAFPFLLFCFFFCGDYFKKFPWWLRNRNFVGINKGSITVSFIYFIMLNWFPEIQSA